MTGVVMALAGLACGDRGPGVSAARAPVEIGFGQRWEGLSRWDGGVDMPPLEVDFKRGYYRFLPDGGRRVPFRVTAIRGQDIRVRWSGQERLGIFEFEGGTLHLVVGERPGARPRSFDQLRGVVVFHLVPATHTRPPAKNRLGAFGTIPGLPGNGGMGFPLPGMYPPEFAPPAPPKPSKP